MALILEKHKATDPLVRKLVTTIVSTFTAHYVYQWGTYFPDTPLQPPHLPSFDGRAVVYPNTRIFRDYMSWRQVDCHINNLYNTTFWTMVQQGGMSNTDAEQELKGTVSSDKNEILFKRFGINYNNEEEIYKKGSVLYRQVRPLPASPNLHAERGTVSTRRSKARCRKSSRTGGVHNTGCPGVTLTAGKTEETAPESTGGGRACGHHQGRVLGTTALDPLGQAREAPNGRLDMIT